MLTNVDKYLSKFANKIGESTTGKSRYYEMDNRIIRVSDHIGRNSDGCFHIIVKPNGYLIHHPATGTVNICTYREVQEFIRSLKFIPTNITETQTLVVANKDESILGIPLSAFTPGQINSIMSIVKKITKVQ